MQWCCESEPNVVLSEARRKELAVPLWWWHRGTHGGSTVWSFDSESEPIVVWSVVRRKELGAFSSFSCGGSSSVGGRGAAAASGGWYSSAPQRRSIPPDICRTLYLSNSSYCVRGRQHGHTGRDRRAGGATLVRMPARLHALLCLP